MDSKNPTMVIYAPLYPLKPESTKLANIIDVRPLQMFLEEVTKDGKTFPRFQKITDEHIIEDLEENKRGVVWVVFTICGIITIIVLVHFSFE
jgi:hypothetical protein